jgi:hypothetical protein
MVPGVTGNPRTATTLATLEQYWRIALARLPDHERSGRPKERV